VSLQALLAPLQPLFAAAFVAWGSPFTWIEIVAFALSIWMVVCNMRVQPIAWPLAMVASLLYALLFADGRLYGEAGLQLFFVAMAGWGWWQWLRGHDAQGALLVVRPLAPRIGWRVVLATAASYPLLVALLERIGDASPRLDALPTVGSIAGQFLLGRKYIENWPVWLAVNLVSIALFATRALWLTVLLYAVFAVLSVAGWRAWGALRGRRSAAAPAGSAASAA
jgi:nicotinamide mononucleotide transporter